MQCMDLHRSTVKCSVWTYTEVQLRAMHEQYTTVQLSEVYGHIQNTVKCSVWTYTEEQLSAVYGPTQKYS